MVQDIGSMSSDVRRILVAQACRAFAYGFASVLLGVSLAEHGWSSSRVSLLLTAVIVGTAIATVVVGTYGDRIGRRRVYAVLFAGLASTGVVFALSDRFWVLVPVALMGALSTDVVESGPFTTLEQAMLPQGAVGRERTRIFGRYNAIATVAGSLGALAAGGPALLRDQISGGPADQRFFLVLVPAGIAGLLIALTLSPAMETAHPHRGYFLPLKRSRPSVLRLSSLFAIDAFGGGFVVQSFIAYWFRVKFDVSTEVIGAVFFGVGLAQSASFLVAARIADRIGLLNTMVFTHLPSNVLLAAIPLAPTLGVAIALLLARVSLSQMDVPTRQAYIATLIPPDERTAAVAYTNSARYAARPGGAALAGIAQQAALGMPFFLGGGIKICYDVALWLWFRRIELPAESAEQRPKEATA
jgi:Arabinose efflux permease